jgi:hypothetical protein
MNFQDWKIYFESNRDHFDHLDWNRKASLTMEEKENILHSIQQFQRGENSEGKHLFNRAGQLHSTDYVEAIKLFIKEEQTHALVLGRFMEIENIPRIKNHWVDGVFRWLRSLSGLENSIMVLITAEIIAAVYYKALKGATQSSLLKHICDQILKDEEMHINFQSFALKSFYDRKSTMEKWMARVMHRTLMTGTIFVVWIYHRKIYRAAGFNFSQFESETMHEYLRSHKMIVGRETIIIRNHQDDKPVSENTIRNTQISSDY